MGTIMVVRLWGRRIRGDFGRNQPHPWTMRSQSQLRRSSQAAVPEMGSGLCRQEEHSSSSASASASSSEGSSAAKSKKKKMEVKEENTVGYL